MHLKKNFKMAHQPNFINKKKNTSILWTIIDIYYEDFFKNQNHNFRNGIILCGFDVWPTLGRSQTKVIYQIIKLV